MPAQAAPSRPDAGAWPALLGLLVYYGLISVGYLALTRGSGVIPWPFARVASLGEAYGRVLQYLPVVALCLAALLFARRSDRPLARLYRGSRPGWLAYVALLGSLAYAASMLGRHPDLGSVAAFLPPLLLLSALNSLAEETVYRGAFMELLQGVVRAPGAVVLLQALVYAAPHYFIAPRVALLAFGFGCVLGALRLRQGELGACLLCHPIVDLGAIGAPFLPRP